jgi:hypothetical protein
MAYTDRFTKPHIAEYKVDCDEDNIDTSSEDVAGFMKETLFNYEEDDDVITD